MRTMFQKVVVLGCAAVLFGALAFAQSTVYVSPSGSDSSGSGSAQAPFQTIAKAISAAPAGGQVVLEPGTYKEAVSIDKALTLTSDASKPGAVASTVIDGTGQQNAITVSGPAAAGTVIQGITVENALKAGILVMQTSKVTIRDNIVTANDQSCAGYPGCSNPNSDLEAPQGTFTFTNDVPCGNVDYQAHPGSDCEALHLIGVTDSMVLNNTVENNLDGGIYLTDEAGPTTGVLVEGNLVRDNQTDCGITLASHNPMAVKDPNAGGVYGNTVRNNATFGNGGAGILMAGPMPGAASYQNTVANNVVEGNGMPGIVVHSHTPGQNMNGNVITGNYVSGNGAGIGDPDAKLSPQQTTGIVVFSLAAPLTGAVVQNNIVTNQVFGVWISSTVQQPVLSGNQAAGSGVGTLVKLSPTPTN